MVKLPWRGDFVFNTEQTDSETLPCLLGARWFFLIHKNSTAEAQQ